MYHSKLAQRRVSQPGGIFFQTRVFALTLLNRLERLHFMGRSRGAGPAPGSWSYLSSQRLAG